MSTDVTRNQPITRRQAGCSFIRDGKTDKRESGGPTVHPFPRSGVGTLGDFPIKQVPFTTDNLRVVGLIFPNKTSRHFIDHWLEGLNKNLSITYLLKVWVIVLLYDLHFKST